MVRYFKQFVGDHLCVGLLERIEKLTGIFHLFRGEIKNFDAFFK